ncbi:MAG: rhodanese-like domain-containing protein [Acidobacteriia bacterium]|nr:rhodanese-like domain-containing protein [Terriglobia bacterium]
MKSVRELVAEANSKVTTLPAAEAIQLLKNWETDVAFIDLRDTAELQREGKIPGAVHANRGMLEFYVDAASPFHNPVFSSGKRLVFYCAGGGRSALAASTAQTMGVEKVSHVGGGFKAWKEAGGPVVSADKE